MKRYLLLIAGAALLFSCTDPGKDGPNAGQEAICFDVAAEEIASRAAGEIATEAALRTKTIGVFASYTGKLTYENTTVSPDYMYNQPVSYQTSAGVWGYAPEKFWPNDPNDYVSFFAYAPYEATPEEGSATGIIGMSRTVDLGDPWINFRLPAFENQVDLLYGQRRTYNAESQPVYTSWLDQHKRAWGEAPMVFVFRHALACIGDNFTVKMSDALYEKMRDHNMDITFTNVTVRYSNLATKARLVLRSAGSPNWKEIISGELLCSRTFDSGTLDSGLGFSHTATSNPAAITLDTGHGLFYIPLQIAGTPRPQAEIYLTYKVTSANPGTTAFTDVATALVSFGPAEAGTKQAFALTLNADFNLEADVVTAPGGITMPGTITPTPGF